MPKFDQDTAVWEKGGLLGAALSSDWAVWGPNGGYISSIALRAAGKVAPSDHRPATYSCQYLSTGQFAGVDIDAQAVRKGRNVWCINVLISQNAKPLLQAQVLTTNKSDGPKKIDRKMPDVPRPDALKSWQELFPESKGGFSFWQNFESKPIRVVADLRTADPRGSVNQDWYRFRDFQHTHDPFLDFARALTMIDTYPWPSFGRAFDHDLDYVAPSLDMTAWFHEPPGKSEWLLADAYADVAGGALIHGGVRIWSDDGRPIAIGASNLLVVQRDR